MKKLKSAVRNIVLLTSVGVIGLSAVPAFAADAPPAPLATGGGNDLETIVVTARRREEKSQDVPIAITSFSAARLAQQVIQATQDLQASVPSLVVGQNSQGVRDASTFTLRGQGTTFEGSSGVATYLNEVPLPTPITLSNQGGPGNFLDLESLQVLAGPQGTLFGRNTTGGAVLLVPHKPTDKFEGYVQGSYGNYNDREIEGVVNLPLIPGVLKTRLTFQSKDRDGYTHDYYWNVNRDDTHYWTARLGIDFSPSSNFDNYTMAYITHSHNNGPGVINEGYNVPGMIGTFAYEYTNGLPQYGVPAQTIGCDPVATNGPIGCNTAAAYYTNLANQAKAYGIRGNALSVNEFEYTRTWGITNTSKWQVTPNVAIRNIVSYTDFKDGYAIDMDGTPAPDYDTGYNGYTLFGTSLPGSNTSPRDSFYDITEELQVQGTALHNNLTYTVGGFYFDMEPHDKSVNSQYAAAVDLCDYATFAGALAANLNPQSACFPNTSNFWVSNKSKAIYAQGTYNLGDLVSALDKLRLTAGVRYTWDNIAGYSSFVGGFSAVLKSSAPTWTVGLDYKATPNLMFYGKASRGYKAGGINTYAVFPNTETFGPEYNTTYEIGMKDEGRVVDMPYRFNLALYRTDYSKIQLSAPDSNPAGLAGAVIFSTATAVIQGVELDATIKPIPQIEIGGNFSYTDAYYTKFPYTPNISMVGFTDCDGTAWNAGTQLNFKCRPLLYVAPYIFSIHANLKAPIDRKYGDLSLFVSLSHSSSQHTEALLSSTEQPYEQLEGYSLVNLSLNWENMLQSPVSASFFVTNLTDKAYRTQNSSSYQSQFVQSTTYGEPRMYGVRLKVAFGK